MNAYWLFAIIPASLIIGFFSCFFYFLNSIKKATGVKSWKKFLNQIKKQQELSKKMEGKGLKEVLNDPELKKQIEQFQKKFKQ
jgi:hypothetical protein